MNFNYKHIFKLYTSHSTSTPVPNPVWEKKYWKFKYTIKHACKGRSFIFVLYGIKTTKLLYILYCCYLPLITALFCVFWHFLEWNFLFTTFWISILCYVNEQQILKIVLRWNTRIIFLKIKYFYVYSQQRKTRRRWRLFFNMSSLIELIKYLSTTKYLS